MKAFAQRLLLVAFGLVLAAVALEGMLRLAAAILPTRLQRAVTRQERPPEPDEVQILCVGDSHTYGVGVAPEESYPAQLERALRVRGVRARVVNAGIPGQDSAQVRAQLQAKLDEYHPQVVMVWVGANNQWRPLDDDATAVTRWTENLRLVRLARLLLSRIEGVTGDFRRDLDVANARRGETTQQLGTGKRQARSVESTANLTKQDLGPIVAEIRAAGATPVLLTYPVTLGPMLTAIDAAIVDAGAAANARVVDLRVTARRHLVRVSHWVLPDLHPAAPLYRAIGWEIARTLVRDGVVAPPAATPPPAGGS